MKRKLLANRSRGHLGWQDGLDGCEPFEIYIAGLSVWRAPAGNVIDVDTGYRIGRELSTVRNLETYGPDVVIGPGFHPTGQVGSDHKLSEDTP